MAQDTNLDGHAYSDSHTCECGCGRPTTIAKRDYKHRGLTKGQPYRFIQGHNRKTGSGPYTYASGKGGKREHVLIAKKALGKPLPEGAEVHHVNGDKRDNRNCNLVICQDTAYHLLLHARQRVYEAGGDPNTDRICTRCKQVKPLTEFYKDSSNASGIGYKCRPCGIASAEESAERRRTKPKKLYRHERVMALGGDPLTQLVCSRCGELKNMTEFPKDRFHPSGYSHACKPCACAKASAYLHRKRLERNS